MNLIFLCWKNERSQLPVIPSQDKIPNVHIPIWASTNQTPHFNHDVAGKYVIVSYLQNTAKHHNFLYINMINWS